MNKPFPHPRRWLARLHPVLARGPRTLLIGLLGGALLGAPAWAKPIVPSVAGATTLDRLTLLVPDGADAASWQVKVWLDTAAEEGIRLDLITDSQLLALGKKASTAIAGLIVPDSAHLQASAAVVSAIKQYAYLGGKLMLVYDAGVLTEAGVFPATGNARFADMVGVDYALWNNGQGAATMVGFGPVVGTRARLDALSFPPGKYLPYVAPASLAVAVSNTAFVPASLADPGGSAAMKTTLVTRAAKGIDDGSSRVRQQRRVSMRQLLGIGVDATAQLRFQRRNLQASKATDGLVLDRVARTSGQIDALLLPDNQTVVPLSAAQAVVIDSTLQAISGYGFGALGYYSYVTTGSFPGTVHLSSPEHGLVAGHRAYGSGQLLFVNMPLGYFKAIGTDGAPLHGYLGHFARDTVGVATQSVQPRARGGLVYNWHIDDGNDLTVNTRSLLNTTDVLKHGPFSIHLTAGPDVITPGDGRGMNLNGSAASQDLLRRLASVGRYANLGGSDRLPAHAIGSHGGWIHDFWGANANEANSPDLTSLLSQNFDAIERVTGRRIREYSSPQGNTPAWAIRWLEQRGVVAMYLVGDVGSGMTRSWRDGQRLSGKLWTSPLTPLGKYATFEEFEEFGITDSVSGQWLLDLQSFAVNHRTNRMFYNHPPGAAGHLPPINALMARGDVLAKDKRFDWYSMTELADFAQRRVETVWTTTPGVQGLTTFSASHPTSLANISWLLPKARFSKPAARSGQLTVDSSDAVNWIVTVESGREASFNAIQF